MTKRTYLIAAAALTLLTACNGPSAPAPTPPPHPDLETAPADLPPPPLLGGPPEEQHADDGTLLGGPYATEDHPGPLTTFRRPDVVEVTVMRPIPNPGSHDPVPPHPRVHDRIGDLLAAQSAEPAPATPVPAPAPTPTPAPAAPKAQAPQVEALAPTQPVPPPKVVEQPKRAAPPHGAHHRAHIKPPESPKAVVPPVAAPAKPTLVDRMSQDSVPTPGGETSPKALLGGLLLLAAMVLLVAIARRMARAREIRERERRAARRAAIEAPADETPPEPDPKP